ncbi:MAG: GtrA family protein [Acidobacteria bacterium]|nr:GtrA family protein [Acidobacteriota bacterium]
MPRPWEQFRQWSRSHSGKKLIRFTAASAITTAVSNGTILLSYGLHVIDGIFTATLVGNLVAILPSYYLTRAWAWGKRGRSHWRREVIPYWSLSLIGIAFAMLGAAWVKEYIHDHHYQHVVNTLLVTGMNLVSFAIFWVLKILLFNRIFHTHTLEAIDEHLSEEEAERV